MKKSNILRRAFSLLLLLFVCIGLSSCGEDTFKERYRDTCSVFVDALISDDADAAYATFAPDATTYSQFHQFWQQFAPAFKDKGSYALYQVGWRVDMTLEQSTYLERYFLQFDDSLDIYEIEIVGKEGQTEILSFYIQEIDDAFVYGDENDAPVFLQILVAVWSLAGIAFTVWMLIDCIRRPMAKKGWMKGWMLLLIALGGFTVGVTRGLKQVFTIDFSISTLFGTSDIIIDSEFSTLYISVYIPIFVLIYFFIRKKIKPPAAPSVEFPAEADEEAARTDEPNEAPQTVEEAPTDNEQNGENPV